MKIIRTINLIVIDSKKKKICLMKKNSEDISLKKWGCIGSSKKKEEDDIEIAKKILLEDLSSKSENITFFTKTTYKTKNSLIKSKYYYVEIQGKITLNTQKYSEYQWESIDEELYLYDYLYDQKKIIELLLRKVNFLS